MAELRVKAGVRPPIVVMLAAVANVAMRLPVPRTVTITSGNDSTHREGSQHYENAALDIRSKVFTSVAAKREFLAAVLKRLGPHYSMLLEDVGEPNEHFHLQKRKAT